MVELEFVDLVVATALALAALRGLLIGLIREAFSLLSIAIAYIAIRYFVDPGAVMLDIITGNAIPDGLSPWVVGSLIFMVTIALVTSVGRTVRRTVRGAGLGLMDRMGGGLLGAAEGILVVAVLFHFAMNFFGRDHPTVMDTYTLKAFEKIERAFKDPPEVAIHISSLPQPL